VKMVWLIVVNIMVDVVFDDGCAEAYQERNHGGSDCQEQVF